MQGKFNPSGVLERTTDAAYNAGRFPRLKLFRQTLNTKCSEPFSPTDVRCGVCVFVCNNVHVELGLGAALGTAW